MVLATQERQSLSSSEREVALVGGCQVVDNFQHHILGEVCKRKSCRGQAHFDTTPTASLSTCVI